MSSLVPRIIELENLLAAQRQAVVTALGEQRRLKCRWKAAEYAQQHSVQLMELASATRCDPIISSSGDCSSTSIDPSATVNGAADSCTLRSTHTHDDSNCRCASSPLQQQTRGATSSCAANVQQHQTHTQLDYTGTPLVSFPNVGLGTWAGPIPNQSQLPGLEFNWSPAAALRALSGSPPPDFSTEGFRNVLREFVTNGAYLLLRVQQNAPDAEAAVQLLETARQQLLTYCALSAVAHRPPCVGPDGKPLLAPMFAVVMRPLDDAVTEPAERDHWEWACAQMNVDDEQRELISALLDIWRTRSNRIAAAHELLLRQCTDHAHDGLDVQHQLLGSLVAVRIAFEVHTAVFLLTLYGSILSAKQVATLAVSAWPYVPSLHVLHAVLCGQGREVQQRPPTGAGEMQEGRGDSFEVDKGGGGELASWAPGGEGRRDSSS